MAISRDLQPVTDTWDLSPLFPNFEAWEKELQEESAIDYTALSEPYRTTTPLTPTQLRALFDEFYTLDRRLRKLYTWAHLFHDQDIANDKGKQALQKIMVRYHLFGEAYSWMDPHILSHSLDQIQAFTKSPLLEPYKVILDRLVRLKAHTLPAEQEEIMALSNRATASAGKAFSAINDADFKFRDVADSTGTVHPLTHGTYGVLLRNPDRTLRQHSFETLHTKYSHYENTIAELLNGEIQSHFFQAKTRKYGSCLEAALYPKDIPTSVYHSLISTVRNNVSSLHRYIRLKKKALKIQEIHPWDLYVPITAETPPSYSFDQAVEATVGACSILGKEYVDRLSKGLSSQRWVDRYENLSKRSGAYSSGCYDSPPYILMNFKGLLRDVFTLAHEAGHSMHSDKSKTQPYQYSDYAIFVAEVASTFNEELLSSELLRAAAKDPAAQSQIINEKLEDFRGTLFRQTMFAEFELFVHEQVEQGEPITPKILSDKYAELHRFYYGEELIPSALIDIEWARIPHFYYNFYVYQYATGISAACALVDRVTTGGQKEKDDYLTFLASGSSHFPIELLKKAGVDMLSGEPVLHAIRRFDTLLDQMEALLPKLSTRT